MERGPTALREAIHLIQNRTPPADKGSWVFAEVEDPLSGPEWWMYTYGSFDGELVVFDVTSRARTPVYRGGDADCAVRLITGGGRRVVMLVRLSTARAHIDLHAASSDPGDGSTHGHYEHDLRHVAARRIQRVYRRHLQRRRRRAAAETIWAAWQDFKYRPGNLGARQAGEDFVARMVCQV